MKQNEFWQKCYLIALQAISNTPSKYVDTAEAAKKADASIEQYTKRFVKKKNLGESHEN